MHENLVMVDDGHVLRNHYLVAKLEDVGNDTRTNQLVSAFELHVPPDQQRYGPVP